MNSGACQKREHSLPGEMESRGDNYKYKFDLLAYDSPPAQEQLPRSLRSWGRDRAQMLV